MKEILSKVSPLNLIEENLRRQGFAGKTDIPKIVFIAATTRHFNRPVSLVVMGPSGAGKTYAIDSGLQFVNPEAIEAVSGMSEKALPYLADTVSLKNRVLYVGEQAGLAEGDGRTFLRQLLSENKIEYLSVQKGLTGMKTEKLKSVEGPVSFMMATTANRLHHEDQSRMLTLNISEDPERVREALRNQALGKSKQEVQLDLGEWHEFNRELGNNKREILIPYAERIADALPTTSIRIQRDFPKVLSMLKACALVHLFQREEGDNGEITANREDYEIVHSLLQVPLSQGLEYHVKPGVVQVVNAVEQLSKKGNSVDGISHSKLAEYLNMDRSVVGRNVHSAISEGYLVNKNPGQGREAKVELGERPLKFDHVLPDPKDIFEEKVQTKRNPW